MSFLLLASTSVAFVFAFWFIKWNKLRKYWAQLGVPHLPPCPLLGSLTFIQRQNPGLWFRDMYKRLKTPYIGIWLIWRPALIVNTPELARQILLKDSAIFRDRYVSSGATDPIGALNIFTVNDPIWSNVRRKLTTIFTSAKLKALHGYTYLKAKELVQRIERDRKKGLELKELFVDYTTDVIGTFSLGVESNATLTSKGPLRKVTKGFMKFSVYRGISWFSIFFCPQLVDIFRLSFFPKSTITYFKKIFKTIINQRCNNVEGKESKDLIDILIEMKKENDDNNEGLHEDILIAQAAILLFGGFDSSANILSYTIYELAFHDGCQEKLYSELKEADKRTRGNLNAQNVADLKYLNCVFKECLRKYPQMGFLDRVASADYQIDDKLTITAGTVIYVNAIGMHCDPEYFPEPDKFNPDRFLPENEINIKPYTFLPFGDGPRTCIGQRFANMTIRTAVSQLILKYKVRPLPNSPRPNEVKVGCKGIFLQPGEPLRVEFIPRKERLHEDILIAQAAILLFGGFDSSANILSYTIYELAFHDGCQEKLYSELKEADKRTRGNLNAQNVADLKYLNCVFKECLRKYPQMGFLDRVASADYQIDDKLTITAGTVIYVNAIGMHCDPEYFPEPDKFNPDRFLPENEINIKPYTFLPFGDGPRTCIGQRFANMTIRTAVSQLILKYKVRPLPNSPRPNEVKVGCKGIFLQPGEPLRVEFIPRKESD